MKKTRLIFLAIIIMALLPQVLSSTPNESRRIARGRYLVEDVSMCGDCHTPLTANGQPNRQRWLDGAQLGFKPLHPMPWFAKSPRIAGLPGLTKREAVKLLETGLLPNGQRLLPPMPQFRFSHRDAEAVVAYLESLKKP